MRRGRGNTIHTARLIDNRISSSQASQVNTATSTVGTRSSSSSSRLMVSVGAIRLHHNIRRMERPVPTPRRSRRMDNQARQVTRHMDATDRSKATASKTATKAMGLVDSMARSHSRQRHRVILLRAVT